MNARCTINHCIEQLTNEPMNLKGREMESDVVEDEFIEPDSDNEDQDLVVTLSGIIDPWKARYRTTCAFCGERIEWYDAVDAHVNEYYFCNENCREYYRILQNPNHPENPEIQRYHERLIGEKKGKRS
jgi:hypothetical protein